MSRRIQDLGPSICKEDSVAGVGEPRSSALRTILKNYIWGTSLMAQWLRIRLPMQGTQVRALVRKDPTCRGATKPLRHSY